PRPQLQHLQQRRRGPGPAPGGPERRRDLPQRRGSGRLPGRHGHAGAVRARAHPRRPQPRGHRGGQPMSAPDQPGTPEPPHYDNDDTDDDGNDATEEATPMTTADSATTPDQPIYEPLPYGSGFAPTQHYGYGAAPGYGVAPGYGAAPGYGVAPEPAASTSPAVPATERSGSPVLAVAGLLSMGVAVWAIVGAPVLTTAIMLAAGLVV